jgi:hypothetical protein
MRLLLRLQHRSKSEMHCSLRYLRATELNNEVVFTYHLTLLLLLLTIRCSKDCACMCVYCTLYCVYRSNRFFPFELQIEDKHLTKSLKKNLEKYRLYSILPPAMLAWWPSTSFVRQPVGCNSRQSTVGCCAFLCYEDSLLTFFLLAFALRVSIVYGKNRQIQVNYFQVVLPKKRIVE